MLSMKTLKRLFLIFPLMSLSCYVTQQDFEEAHWDSQSMGPLPVYRQSKIDILELAMLPDSGYLFQFMSADSQGTTDDPASKLRRLYALGIKTVKAWYRQPTGACQEPGSSGFGKTFYREFFLIYLNEPSTLPERYSFRSVTRPKYLPCPYYVSLFTPDFEGGYAPP